MANKIHRLNHIIKEDKRTFIVAIDHGNIFNVLPELMKPEKIIKEIAKGGADAFLATVGLVDKFPDAFMDKGIILRLDGGMSMLGNKDKSLERIFTVEDALRLGADAVICMGFPGSKWEEKYLKNLSRNVAECNKWGVPLLAEMLPMGFEGGEGSRTDDNLAFACRLGAEMGADMIKTYYTGCKEGFRKLIESTYVPVVILGGGKRINEEKLLRDIKEALDIGASGVAIGRNIWKHPNPQRLTAAIAKIVHGDYSVNIALKELNKIY
ncbi:class I fructose-bisphosphate aldolase [Thermohalobacter berrensis]|uniref:Aldolase n=1 Tax=Thermohalobacter berrensis TaxID=99594 RepID=A0A419T9Q9_9FIRM|nr:aldolase [Thermohalobacter berrensis]RKD34212.1 aldolase [Thermohalobacter berrensis]